MSSYLPPVVVEVVSTWDAAGLRKAIAEINAFTGTAAEKRVTAKSQDFTAELAALGREAQVWADKPIEKRIQWPKTIAGQTWLDAAAKAAAKQSAKAWNSSVELKWPKRIGGQTWLESAAKASAKASAKAWNSSVELKWPKRIGGQTWLDTAATASAKASAKAWAASAELKWPKTIAGQSWLDTAAAASAKQSAKTWMSSDQLKWPKEVAGQSWLDLAAIASAKEAAKAWNSSVELKWPKTIAGQSWLDAAAAASAQKSAAAWAASKGANGRTTSAFWPTVGAVAGAKSGGGGGGAALWAALLGHSGGKKGGFLGSLPAFGSFAALGGFGLETMIAHALGIGGSVAGGFLGGGLLAGGALSTAAVGFGTNMAGIGQAANDISMIVKDQNALNQAVAVYGKNSFQAQAAAAQLNYDLHSFSPIAQKAVLATSKLTIAFEQMFDKYTGLAEKLGAQIIGQGIKTATPFLPVIGHYAAGNMSIMKRMFSSPKGLFTWLDNKGTTKLNLPGIGKRTIGTGGLGVFTNLEQLFQSQLPTGIRAATQALEFFSKTMDVAAQYTGPFVAKIAAFFTTMNKPSHFGKWATTVGHLIGLFHTLMSLVVSVGQLLITLFSPAVGFGQSFLQLITTIVQHLRKFFNMKGTQNVMHSLFNVHLKEVIKGIGGAILALLPFVEQLVLVWMQVTTVVSGFVSKVLGVLDPALKMIGKIPFATQIGGWGAAFLIIRSRGIIPFAGALSKLPGPLGSVGKGLSAINQKTVGALKSLTAFIKNGLKSIAGSVGPVIRRLLGLGVAEDTAGASGDVAAEGTTVAAGGVKALNVALAGGILLALAALALAAYEIYKHWGTIWPKVKAVALAAWHGIEAAAKGVWRFMKSIWSDIEHVVAGAWKWIKTHLGIVVPAAMGLILGPVGALVGLMATHWNTIKKGVGAAWDWIYRHLSAVWHGIGSIAGSVFGGIGNVIGGVWRTVRNAISSAWQWIYSHLVAVWGAIQKGAGAAWGELEKFFHTTIGKIVIAVTAPILGLVLFLVNHWHTISRDARSVWGSVLHFIESIPNKILGVFKGAGKLLVNIGRELVQGLWNGIKSLASAPVKAFGSIAHHVMHALTHPWEIFSPSRVAKGYGQNIVRGLTLGLQDSNEKAKQLAHFTNMVANSTRAILSSIKQFEVAGKQIMQSLNSGIMQGLPRVLHSVHADTEAMYTAFESSLPKFQNVGKGIAQAIATGIKDGEAQITAAIQSSVTVAIQNTVTSTMTNVIRQTQQQIATSTSAGAGMRYH